MNVIYSIYQTFKKYISRGEEEESRTVFRFSEPHFIQKLSPDHWFDLGSSILPYSNTYMRIAFVFCLKSKPTAVLEVRLQPVVGRDKWRACVRVTAGENRK